MHVSVFLKYEIWINIVFFMEDADRDVRDQIDELYALQKEPFVHCECISLGAHLLFPHLLLPTHLE